MLKTCFWIIIPIVLTVSCMSGGPEFADWAVASIQSNSYTGTTGTNWETILYGPSGRYNHTMTVFQDKLFVLFGEDNDSARNDVWSTEDGTNWRAVTTNAPRNFTDFGCAIFNNAIWVAGGPYETDVWCSTNGSDWKKAVSNAPFGHDYILWGRITVFNNRLWMVTHHYNTNSSTNLSEIWNTADGTNWNLVTSNAAFGPRDRFSLIVFNNKLWLLGGRYYVGYSTNIITNDIWSTGDGSNWSQAAASSGHFAPIPRAYGAQVAVHQNKLWIISGYGYNYNPTYDTYNLGYMESVSTTADGINWTVQTNYFSDSYKVRRYFGSMVSYKNRLWMISGINGTNYSGSDFTFGNMAVSD